MNLANYVSKDKVICFIYATFPQFWSYHLFFSWSKSQEKKIFSSDISLCLFLGNPNFPKLLLDSEAFEFVLSDHVCMQLKCFHFIFQPSMLCFDCWLYRPYAYAFNCIQILVLVIMSKTFCLHFFLSRQDRKKAWKSSIEKLRVDYIFSPSTFLIYTH